MSCIASSKAEAAAQQIRNLYELLGERVVQKFEMGQLAGRLNDKEREIEALRNTMSWRITHPLRVVQPVVADLLSKLPFSRKP